MQSSHPANAPNAETSSQAREPIEEREPVAEIDPYSSFAKQFTTVTVCCIVFGVIILLAFILTSHDHITS